MIIDNVIIKTYPQISIILNVIDEGVVVQPFASETVVSFT